MFDVLPCVALAGKMPPRGGRRCLTAARLPLPPKPPTLAASAMAEAQLGPP